MDVTLPDGTTVKGVPEGTTKAQLAQKLQANGRNVPAEWLQGGSNAPTDQTKATPPAEKAKEPPGGLSSNIAGMLGISPDTVSAIHDPLAKGVADVAGLPVDTITNIRNLLRAGGGTIGHAAFGTELPDVLDPGTMVGGSEYFKRAMEQAGSTNPAVAPTTPAGRVGSAALEVAPMAILGGGKNLGQVVKQIPGMMASGGAGQTVAELGGGPAAQITASMIPGAAKSAGAGSIEAMRKAATKGVDIPARQQLFQEAGVTNPSAGELTGNKPLQTAEKVSAKALGGGRFDAEVAKQQAGMEGKIESVVNRMAPGGASPTRGGIAIEKGLEKFKERFGNRQEKAEQKAGQYMKPADQIEVSRTRQVLSDAVRRTPGEEALTSATGSPTLKKWYAALEEDLSAPAAAPSGLLGPTGKPLPPSQKPQGKNTVSYETLRTLRTQIGRAIGNQGMFPDVPKEDLKALYGALTSDLGAGFAAKGGEAAKAWQRSQEHYRKGSERIRDVLSRVSDKGSPEEMFKAATAGTKEGATRIARLLNSLPASERGVVSGVFIERLGRATLDAPFSFDKFVTDWQRLHGDAKKAVMQGQSLKDMETVARVAEEIKNSGKTLQEPRKTTFKQYELAGSVGSVLTSLFLGHPMTAAGVAAATGTSAAANALFAKAVHDPKFIHWMAEGSKIPTNQAQKHAARLYQIAKQTQDNDAQEAEATIALYLGAEQEK